jgi:heme-degrading monooxygenase HmoA
MFAVLGQWTMDPTRSDVQERELNERIVPAVRETAGFVEARWTRHADRRRHTSFIVFEDEASATAFASWVRRQDQPRRDAGVANDSLEIYEVVASA